MPFLALGLPFALERARALVALLIAVSLVATTAIEVSWALTLEGYGSSIWTPIVHLPRQRGASSLVADASHNILDWLGSNRTDSEVAVAFLVAAAFVVSLLPAPRR